jgi:hypothetical protein
MSEMFTFSYTLSGVLIAGVNALATSADDFLTRISRGMAKDYVAPIATQTSPRPALLVQSRISKIVSRVPKSALWLLVTANLLYIFLAVSLTALALMVTSMDVYQLRTRLSVVGLASQLFEGAFSGRAVKDERQLFDSRNGAMDGQKRVRVKKDTEGGTMFEVEE